MKYTPKARMVVKNTARGIVKGASICLIVIQVLVVALPGIYFISSGFYDVYYMTTSNDWPTTTGEVIGKYQGKKNETYITYRYTVNNNVYQNMAISFADDPDEKFLEKIEVGQQIKVYFSKNKFHESLLIPGLQWRMRTMVAFLLGALFSGVFFVLIRLKYKNKIDSINTIDPVNWI